jgi:RNA polymerase sigma-70 factor (ECF subfamily)
MPPYDLWMQGPDEIVGWMLGPGRGCEGSKLLATSANGTAAFGSYRPAAPGRWEPWALQVIEVRDGAISGHHSFLYPELFAEFGLPPVLTDDRDRGGESACLAHLVGDLDGTPDRPGDC